MEPEADDEIEFDLPTGKITVTTRDLDAIRRALIAYLKASSEEMRDTFVKELEIAMTWIDDEGVGRINQWLLEKRGAHLALVRHPPRGPIMIFFVADLARSPEGEWKVDAFRTERVRGR